MSSRICLPALFLASVGIPASAAPLPEPVRAMIRAALAGNDDAQIKAVVDVARQTNPASAGEIDALIAERTAQRAAQQAQTASAANAATPAKWKGEVELGAARSTGNSDTLGVFGSAGLHRESAQWRHQFTARADLQKTNGVTTTERFLAGWQPNYKFDPRHYAYGLVQYEHDQFLGYTDRFTGGAGAGIAVIDRPGLRIDIEGGPAIRHTRYVEDGGETALAGRGSLSARWQPTPTLTLAQKAAVYLQAGDTNASSTTSLDTKLIGPFRARLSYQIQYERDAPPERDPVDTLSRATLVYSF